MEEIVELAYSGDLNLGHTSYGVTDSFFIRIVTLSEATITHGKNRAQLLLMLYLHV